MWFPLWHHKAYAVTQTSLGTTTTSNQISSSIQSLSLTEVALLPSPSRPTTVLIYRYVYRMYVSSYAYSARYSKRPHYSYVQLQFTAHEYDNASAFRCVFESEYVANLNSNSNSTSTATDFEAGAGATGGHSNNCAAIYAIQFVRWPQTLTKFFDLQNYFYDGASNDFWYDFRQLLKFPLSPLFLSLSPDCHLKWTQIVCVRFIDAHPSDTTAFDQVRRHRRRRRRRTCLSSLCMTLSVCACVYVCVCAPLNQLAYLLKIHI